ncbi:hypothetical protein H4219_001503 [Mycoemilia scoparia]|uniref:Uncharacterized protein n=1 Tax=Mycoemilia scoparia TaxID=417184 RepID=A0A9W8DRR3_9FUNG|nr:hypothetical protein H4219_001503 [Mycoemilia scoparia]
MYRYEATESTSTTTIQYAFDSSAHFPRPFLSPSPRFDFSFNPSLRTLPCVIILHDSEPGGFDIARWIAGGLSHTQHIKNPLMPSSFGSYFTYNLQRNQNHDPFAPQNMKSKDGSKPRKASDVDHVLDNDTIPSFSGTKKYSVPSPPLGLLSISRPGYLLSTTTENVSFQSEALSILRMLDNLRIGTVSILAHGVSAPVAMEMASLPGFRNRTRSLAFINPKFSLNNRKGSSMVTRSSLWPEWLQTWVAYKSYARDIDDPVFLQSISELAGPAAVNEIMDDPVFAELYSDIGVFFTSYGMRRPGVKSDLEKLSALDSDNEKKRRWSFINAPVLCLTTSQSTSGSASDKFSKEADLYEEQSKAALMNIQSTTKNFTRVLGGSSTLFPLGEVAHHYLEFLREYDQIDYMTAYLS